MVLSIVWSTGARGLFLKSPEKFSGLKSQLSNYSVLVLKSQSLKVFFNVRKTKRIARCDGSEPRCCEDIKGIVTPKMGPKKIVANDINWRNGCIHSFFLTTQRSPLVPKVNHSVCNSRPRITVAVITKFRVRLLGCQLKPGFHIVVSVVSVVRKKFVVQIEFILSLAKSCICRFFCIEHLYGRDRKSVV